MNHDPRLIDVMKELKSKQREFDDIVWDHGVHDPRLSALANEIRTLPLQFTLDQQYYQLPRPYRIYRINGTDRIPVRSDESNDVILNLELAPLEICLIEFTK